MYQIFIFLLGHLHFFLHFFLPFMENLLKKHPIPVSDGEILVDADIHGIGIKKQDTMSPRFLVISLGALETDVEGMGAIEIARVDADRVIASEDAPQLAGPAAQRRMIMLA